MNSYQFLVLFDYFYYTLLVYLQFFLHRYLLGRRQRGRKGQIKLRWWGNYGTIIYFCINKYIIIFIFSEEQVPKGSCVIVNEWQCCRHVQSKIIELVCTFCPYLSAHGFWFSLTFFLSIGWAWRYRKRRKNRNYCCFYVNNNSCLRVLIVVNS